MWGHLFPLMGKVSDHNAFQFDEGENTMSLVVNHNMMAANVARNLNAHYGNLSTSTQRLSTGMRINSAADDAAGLAISELQRADIAALKQGARNANDAISLIQTADGAMGVIDEKLIRMKELAEQAATGTYDSTQRLMIESEYQQMASEITRIANATDFNGTKLLDGTLSGVHDGSQMTAKGALKVHFGTGNDSAEDYYYIETGDVTAQALGLGNSSTYAEDKDRIVAEYKSLLEKSMKGWDRGEAWQKKAYELIDTLVHNFAAKIDNIEKVLTATDPNTGAFTGEISIPTTAWGGDAQNNNPAGQNITLTMDQLADAWNRLSEEKKQYYGRGLPSDNMPPRLIRDANNQIIGNEYDKMSDSDKQKVLYAYTRALVDSWSDGDAQRFDKDGKLLDNPVIDASQTSFGDGADVAGNNSNNGWSLTYLNRDVTGKPGSATGDGNVQGARANQGFFGTIYNEYALTKWDNPGAAQGTDVADAIDAARKASMAVYDALHEMSVSLETKYDAAGRSITTQEDAQLALDAITNAIVEKDKVRAHLGALQNRLENTITNLNVQAENLQAAESRIRDVDVATEMTEFTRQQVLTQSAVAMLSQANSLPRMAMQLIGG